MGRAPCCDKSKVKRGPWSPQEDATLKSYLHTHGSAGNWITLPQRAGLKRCGKSCRLRWLNYLRPDIKHGGFTEEEDNIIFTLYNRMGSRWSFIASHLPGRTDNDVKNHWNTKLRKKLIINNTNNINIIIPPPPAASTNANYYYDPSNINFANPNSVMQFPKSETECSFSFLDNSLSNDVGFDTLVNSMEGSRRISDPSVVVLPGNDSGGEILMDSSSYDFPNYDYYSSTNGLDLFEDKEAASDSIGGFGYVN